MSQALTPHAPNEFDKDNYRARIFACALNATCYHRDQKSYQLAYAQTLYLTGKNLDAPHHSGHTTYRSSMALVDYVIQILGATIIL